MRVLPGHPLKRAAAVALGTVLILAAPASAVGQERTAALETPVPESDAWDLERAHVALERLRAEIAVLRGLGKAQSALLAWNLERAETLGPYSGAGPAVLPAALCERPGLAAWCRALPATFGADAGQFPDDATARDGER